MGIADAVRGAAAGYFFVAGFVVVPAILLGLATVMASVLIEHVMMRMKLPL